MSQCYRIIDECWNAQYTPTCISNRLLAHIREATGVYDPYASIKQHEFVHAQEALKRLRIMFPRSLHGALQLSALGNAVDFFTSIQYDTDDFTFFCHDEEIEETLCNNGSDVLIFGDNIGDFFFDMDLVTCLQGRGKKVHYAIKEHPVQNDISMVDVTRFGLVHYFHSIVSTGTREVGIRKEEMRGVIKELWEGKTTIVIAKGMGNYETLSEFSHERQVIHIMKVKCPAVADALKLPVGTYAVTLS